MQDFGDGEARHITGDIRLRHVSRRDAREVASFVVARVGDGDIGRRLVAGDRFESHVREVLRHFQRRLHVAEAGREDQLVALLRQVADHAFGVRALGHVLDIARLDLAAECGLHRLPAFFVLVDPAGVADRRNVDEGHFERQCGRHLGLRHQASHAQRGGEGFAHGGARHGASVAA